MKRQRPKLPNYDSIRAKFHYNTRPSTRRGTSNTESASLRVTKRRRKKNIPEHRSTKSDFHLPIDLVVEILQRLPVKTLSRFLCVSKLWSSIIRCRDFRELFLNESLNRPSRLLFNFRLPYNKGSFVFSSNQTPNPGEATYHLNHPVDRNGMNCVSSVHDLICCGTASETVVYNSTTKRSITLPKTESDFAIKHFLGYDPIDGVYKVLCMCGIRGRLVFKVLTLGKRNKWREIKKTHRHVPFKSHICANGVLYYDAYVTLGCAEVVVMSFDVRSEKFHLIKGVVAPICR